MGILLYKKGHYRLSIPACTFQTKYRTHGKCYKFRTSQRLSIHPIIVNGIVAVYKFPPFSGELPPLS